MARDRQILLPRPNARVKMSRDTVGLPASSRTPQVTFGGESGAATFTRRPRPADGTARKLRNLLPRPGRAFFRRAIAASGIFSLLAFSLPLEATAGNRIVVAQNTLEQSSQNSPCTVGLQEFAGELDRLLDKNPDSVADVSRLLKRYPPASGCNVEVAIAVAKRSKYFTIAYNYGPAYTVSFNSRGFQVSFGLRKDTGNIELPVARVKCGGKDCL